MKKAFAAWLAALLLMAAQSALAGPGKEALIAVAATDNTAAAAVSSQPVRAPYFLIFDGQGTLLESLANVHKEAGDAAIHAADQLAGKGIKVFVAEGFGARVTGAFKDKGIRLVEFKGSAADAAKARAVAQR